MLGPATAHSALGAFPACHHFDLGRLGLWRLSEFTGGRAVGDDGRCRGWVILKIKAALLRFTGLQRRKREGELYFHVLEVRRRSKNNSN